jgi:hypothetical protein
MTLAGALRDTGQTRDHSPTEPDLTGFMDLNIQGQSNHSFGQEDDLRSRVSLAIRTSINSAETMATLTPSVDPERRSNSLDPFLPFAPHE